ncbi:DUF4129 domain-containing protein [Halorientalis halophila]|uniref:DUF4129 domain-containing protein n=1 Tax=Halorientalis halophila TaxID=3108499 RepID=UPI003008171F
MNRTQFTSLLIALVCFGAVGVSASTLSSSVAADPSEALDPDYELIPVAGDGLERLDSAVAQNGDQRAAGGGDGDDGSGGDDSGDDDERADPGAEGEQEADESDPDGSEESEQSNDGAGSDGGGGGGEQEAEAQSGGPSMSGGLGLFDQRFTIADLLTLLGLALLLLATAWVVYRYRDRIRALLAQPDEEAVEDGPTVLTDGPPPDDNEVFESWEALVSSLDVAEPHTLTTRECADAASDEGFDREEIERLRLVFEDVRYGGRPVTDGRRRRARTARERLDIGRNGESP